MTTDIGRARVEVPRHGRDGRPHVILPEFAPDPDIAAALLKYPSQRTKAEADLVKGKSAYYTRCTTLAKAIDDTTALDKWKLRQVAIGLSMRRDLLMNVAAHAVDSDENKRTLNDLCQDALDAAASGRKANVGTALHKLAEYADMGVAVPGIDQEAARDLAAYVACKERYGVTMHSAEQFVVYDEMRVAGTFDRTMSVAHVPGKRFIGDIKTGNITFAANAIAVQLAVYANSSLYDPTTGERTPLDVDKGAAIIIHLPQGEASAELYWVNIADGQRAAHLCHDVKQWRARRDLIAQIGVPA